jgi:hypothetical protein
MRLLDSAGSRGTLTSRLGCKPFSGSFASSGFESSLLGASHDVRVMVLFRIILMLLSYISCGADTIVITEVQKRLGEMESKRCQAKMEEGCHARETLYLGIWICWWTQLPPDSILLDTSLEIHPSTII